jgi:hypothetical protein
MIAGNHHARMVVYRLPQTPHTTTGQTVNSKLKVQIQPCYQHDFTACATYDALHVKVKAFRRLQHQQGNQIALLDWRFLVELSATITKCYFSQPLSIVERLCY